MLTSEGGQKSTTPGGPQGSDADLVLRSTRVLTPEGMRPATVTVAAGTITALLPYDAGPVPRSVDPAAVTDCGDDVLLPGLVDTHVHVNDPGRAEWEGYPSATRAAAAGGVTTLLDMPLNSLPPTTTVDHLAVKRAAAQGAVYVDVGFWGGAIPENAGRRRPLRNAGVFGFKCFLAPSGVEEFPALDRVGLEDAIRELADFDGLLIVHAEDAGRLAAAPPPRGRRYAHFLASRPRAAENQAIADLIALAERFGARVHVLHLSSSDALPLIADAKGRGVRITAETCPHYLTFTAEEIPDGATAFKCCPPIREAANREALWAGLADGTLDCVVSDHSPCTADLKTGDFDTAWGGISSLQLGLSAVWTEARQRGHQLTDVVRWMSTAPAALAGLPSKGAIRVGCDADLVRVAPEETFTVTPAALRHRNQITAYAGRVLRGVVRSSWLRGTPVFGPGASAAPAGRLLFAERSGPVVDGDQVGRTERSPV